jgi:uncharacterized protein YjbI with pentapeptide repeats
MVERGGLRSRFRSTSLVLLLVGFGIPATAAAIDLPVPIVTGATTDLEAGVLTIHGRNFVTSPLPRVQIGTEAGGFQELVVEGAASASIAARLTGQSPGTYRVVVQFGRTGLVIGTLDVAIGTAGPRGPKGDKGDKGEKGDPGPGVDLGVADARYAKLFGNNVYAGNQVIAGSASVLGSLTALSVEVDGSIRVRDFLKAESFEGDGSRLTNIKIDRIGDACVLDHIPGRDSGDGEADALGVIIGFESGDRAICRPLVATECKVVPLASSGFASRELVGRQRLELPYDDRPPVDASNCTVPDGGSIAVGRRPNLSGARLTNVIVTAADDWSFADLSRAEIQLGNEAVMVGANLRGAIIATSKGPDMRLADATGAVFPYDFVSAVFADDATLVAASFQLRSPINSFIRADLRMANLSPRGGGRPTSTTFAGANLSRANLAGNDCRATERTGCDFTGASLREASLRGLRCATPGPLSPSCDFTEADLTGADLTGAQLSSVVLDGTIWSNTTCPDGTNSDLPDGDGSTCLSNLGGSD